MASTREIEYCKRLTEFEPFDSSVDTIGCWAVIIIRSNFTLQEKLKLINWNS